MRASGLPVVGIVILVIGLGALSTQDVIFKQLSARYSVFELLFLRSAFMVLMLRGVFLALRQPDPLRTNRLGTQYLRGTLLFLALGSYYLALTVLPLLDVVAIFYTSPLIATALAALILKEPVGTRRWAAVGLGFAGAVLMIRPGSGAVQTAALLALFAATMYACSVIAVRRLGATDSAATTSYYSTLAYLALSALGTVVANALPATEAGGVVLARAWAYPSLLDLGLLAVSAVAVSVGFFCLAQAYRLGEVPVLAPFEYSSLIWAGILGLLVFGEVPSIETLIGAALIMASGTYVAWIGHRGDSPPAVIVDSAAATTQDRGARARL